MKKVRQAKSLFELDDGLCFLFFISNGGYSASTLQKALENKKVTLWLSIGCKSLVCWFEGKYREVKVSVVTLRSIIGQK